MPLLMNYFERGALLIDINKQIFSEEVSPVVPEFLLWAMTGAGIHSTRRCYEVLETYGDTILKLAATLLAFWLKKEDTRATEGDIENAKGCFVTNFHTFRIGYHNLRTHRFMKIMRDPEPKEWIMPLQKPAKPSPLTTLRKNACPGKSVADSTESLIGAHFLSTDSLRKSLTWINDIKLVPLPIEILKQFDDFEETSFHHLRKIDLIKDCSHFKIEDNLS